MRRFLESLKARCELPLLLNQTRNKFKGCIAICKRIAMLRKTASGVIHN